MPQLDEEKWDDFVEECVKKYGGIRKSFVEKAERGTVSKGKKMNKKSRFLQKPPQQSDDDFCKDILAVNNFL